MIVLGIESSCDETALALVDSDAPSPQRRVLGQALHSQIALHATTGGVVPEVAARAHVARLPELGDQLFAQSGLSPAQVDLVAGIAGPGLIGGVGVGLMYAKGFAIARNIPLVPVNHLAGHALTARLSHDVAYPFLLLLVSGGHSQLVVVEGPTRFGQLATTIDDAVGEAFDKAAKILGLGFPGGPAIEAAARSGDPTRFALPRPMIRKATMDFSFSGLKTATARTLETLDAPSDQDIADLAASFQQAACDALAAQTAKAAAVFVDRYGPGHALVVAGGVARNQTVRFALDRVAQASTMGALVAPPLALCSDNAVMIAWAGVEQFRADPAVANGALRAAPRPRWPLAESGR